MATKVLAPPRPVDPITALDAADKRDEYEAVETLRSVVEAINLGESFDQKEAAQAKHLVRMTTDALRGHAEARKRRSEHRNVARGIRAAIERG